MKEYIEKEAARRIIDSPRSQMQMLNMLKSVPKADVKEVVHAHWIFEERQRMIDETDDGAIYATDKWWKCSNCGHDKGFIGHIPEDNYCPNCGATMDESEG